MTGLPSRGLLFPGESNDTGFAITGQIGAKVPKHRVVMQKTSNFMAGCWVGWGFLSLSSLSQ